MHRRVLAEMQDAIIAREFRVVWGVIRKAVFPLHRKAEKAHIEFMRLGDVKNAQYGSGGAECGHFALLR